MDSKEISRVEAEKRYEDFKAFLRTRLSFHVFDLPDQEMIYEIYDELDLEIIAYFYDENLQLFYDRYLIDDEIFQKCHALRDRWTELLDTYRPCTIDAAAIRANKQWQDFFSSSEEILRLCCTLDGE